MATENASLSRTCVADGDCAWSRGRGSTHSDGWRVLYDRCAKHSIRTWQAVVRGCTGDSIQGGKRYPIAVVIGVSSHRSAWELPIVDDSSWPAA